MERKVKFILEYMQPVMDDKTKMNVVLANVSYNHACDWLASKGFTNCARFESFGDEIEFEFYEPAHRIFRYDKSRNRLLGD